VSATLRRNASNVSPLYMQPFDIGAFHVPDVGVFIESGFQDCDVHWRNLSSAYNILAPATFCWRRTAKSV
jgi:hypothetical protein